MVSLPYLLMCLISAFAVARTTPAFARTLHELLSIVAAILLAVSLAVVGQVYLWPGAYPVSVAAAVNRLSAPLALPSTNNWTPDVYHLVLDGMGRPDTLAERYDLDTDGSIDELKRLGFDVGRSRGHANYVQTHLSLSSMLNLVHLDELLDAQRGSHDRRPLWDLIARARVPSAFKRLGYEVEFIGSGYESDGTFLEADSCDCSQLWFAGSEVLAISMTPFESLLHMGFGHRAHFDRSLRVFARFERARSGSRPRFVFAHTMLPHPPFVADEGGNFTNPRKQLSGADASFFPGTAEEYRTGYRAQATYALGRAVEASRRLLEASRRDRRDAIVIITGDHGPRLGFDARKPTAESGLATLPVLLAIRWPSRARPGPSPGSLVNVYRAVFSKAFGMELPMLADKGYVSSFSTPYQVIAVKGPRGRSVEFAGLAVHAIFSPRLDNPTWIADSRRPQRRATVFACVSEFEKRGSNESGRNSIGPIAGNTRNTARQRSWPAPD